MNKKKKKFILILLLSAIIGIGVGIIVSLFHITIDILFQHKDTVLQAYWPWENCLWLAYMISSALMVFLSVFLVKHFSPEASGSGIQEIEGVVGNKRSMNHFRVIIVKFIGGILSLGSGMAMGREGPSVQIGGAFGQMISRLIKLNKDDINILIAAGAGAGMAATFNAPLAGILFVFEEMKEEINYAYLPVKSVITASVMSIIALRLMIGDHISIPIDNLQTPQISELWIFFIYGIFFGILGFIFNKFLVLFTTKMTKIASWKHSIITISIGSLIGLLLYFYPYSVSEGYNAISIALHNNLSITTLITLFIIRFFTTMLSYATGAPGGIFAPMLALGTLFGVSFGIFANEILPSLHIQPLLFAVVGMSALFSATVRAPITGIVLVAEMTGSFHLLMPLLITSLFAVITANALGGRAIYTILLENTLKISKFGTKS